MTAAEVILWGTRIGAVSYDDASGISSFEYDPDFVRSGIEVSPITMPLSGRVYSFPELPRRTFHGLPGMLADSLPDKFGNAVIRAWLRSQGRSEDSFNAVERLCYTGKRGMGALEYRPALGPAPTASETVDMDRLVQLASDILRQREMLQVSSSDTAMQQILQIGTSAGGARAKAVIAWNETTGDIRSGQVDTEPGYGYWLIKFDGVTGNGDKEGDDDPQYTRIEYAYHLMARAAGIDMTECRLYTENGRRHFMTRRFDREPDTGRKLHMQSLGAIAHYDFNAPGAYSYEQAAEIMRRLHIDKNGFRQLYRRMVFNVLAFNRDDHVKNISFLMDRSGKWSLAPAYDVGFAYRPSGLWTGTHQMTVHGKRENLTAGDLLACADAMGLKPREAEKAIREVEKAVAAWPQYAEAAGLNTRLRDRIGTILYQEQ